MARQLWRHDAMVLTIGVLSIALLYWYDSGAFPPEHKHTLLLLDLGFVIYFLADWLLIWRGRGWSRNWLLWNSWRLLGMVPLYMATFSFLRLLRLARIGTVIYKIPVIRTGFHHLHKNIDFKQLAPLALAASGITLTGAFLVWMAEKDTNPALADFSEALWWSIVTVTTVGYGDITPLSSMGRFVAVLLMVTGIGTIGMLASQVSSAIIEHHGSSDEATDTSTTTTAVARELAELARLHDAGKLDDPEFAMAKALALEGAKKGS